jgi:hypothetical protein
MKIDLRIVFAALALALVSCQGGLGDSGGMGMPGGGMGPPMQQPGPMGSGAMGPGGPNAPGEMAGPTIGPNGQPELAAPGATLAPNEAQYPVADGASGMRCPQFQVMGQLYSCSLSFNLPPPSPSPSPNASGSPKPTPTPSPTPTPKPTSSADDASDDTPTPSPTPPGTITLQMEPLPKDLPPMTNPDPRLLRITPLMAIRLQSDTDFALNGYASASFTLPQSQFSGRSFSIQLYNEVIIRGKRTDQFLGTYSLAMLQGTTVQFSFPTPKVTVKRGQIWLLALYGYQYPPGTTPTPSPSPSTSTSPATSSAASPTASP